MARNAEQKVRVHIWLKEATVTELRELYSDAPGFSAAIQIILERVLIDIRAKREAKAETIRLPNIQEIPS